MTEKDLGVVTAYAYAVEGGYTGTEAEFTALLGDLADTIAELEGLTVTVNTLPAGSSATASYADGVLSLGIPKGDKGDQGDIGPTPDMEIGTVTTLPAGSDATASITGTPENPVLNLGIPKGDKGDTGEVTQAEFDDLKSAMYDIYPTDTASGAIANFPDGADNIPVKSLTIAIEPVQSGSGDPSPDNVRPISGWTEAKVTRTGKNLLENILTTRTVNGTTFTVNDDGSITVSGTPSALTRAPIKTGLAWDGRVTATLSFGTMPTGTRAFARRVYNGAQTYPTISPTSTSPEGAVLYDIYIEIGTAFDGTAFTVYPQMELGTTATAYEPYQGETISINLDGTVYGGTLDVNSGVLTVDRAILIMDGSISVSSVNYHNSGLYYIIVSNRLTSKSTNPLPISDRFKSEMVVVIGNCFVTSSGTSLVAVLPDQSITTKESATAWFESNPTTFVYELATPITVTLSAEQLNTLYGTNNIWADTGDVDVTYRADTGLYIDKLTGSTEDDMIADAPIASGKYFFVGNTLYLSTAAIAAGATLTPGTNCVQTTLAEALNNLNS